MEIADQPIGIRGTRGKILAAIKALQPVTAGQLALDFDLSVNALRRHLRELEADGVLLAGREPRGVGAPAYEYRLSAAGERLFTRGNDDELRQALATVREELGTEAVVGMLRHRWDEVEKRIKDDVLGSEVSRLSRIAAGDVCCEHCLRKREAAERETHNTTAAALAARQETQ